MKTAALRVSVTHTDLSRHMAKFRPQMDQPKRPFLEGQRNAVIIRKVLDL